jgi:preprotein translocase subunit YajC
MLISPAYAQGAGGADAGLMTFLPLILIFVVFYFLLIRPQQKKVKQHREMVGSLRRGDKVVTGGGIIGTVAKVLNDQEILVEIADGVRVRVARGTVADVVAKSAPGAGDAQPAGDAQGKKSGGMMGRLKGQ